MIHASVLSKRYDATLALDRLSLSIPQGAVFGLLGPNGSGKTTFIKLLMGLIFPDTGQIDLGSVRSHRIGYLPERLALPPRSRIDELAQLVGRLAGLEGTALEQAVATSLDRVGLSDVARNRVGACSKGMLQRLGLALALLDNPPLMVLDEPLEGLDPAWQKAIRDVIREQHQAGKTLLISTHRLSDVAELCTDVAILSQGRLKRSGPLAQVLPLRPQVVIDVAHLPEATAYSLAALHPDIMIEGGTVTLAGDALSQKPLVLRHLLDAGVDVQGLRQQRATLEEVYLETIREEPEV